MDWKTLISEIVVAAIGAYLSYKKAIKESNIKIEEVRINAKTEIKKIREEANSEIEKLKVEQEELRKTKKNDSKLSKEEKEAEVMYGAISKFVNGAIENPENIDAQITAFKKMGSAFPNNKQSRRKKH